MANRYATLTRENPLQDDATIGKIVSDTGIQWFSCELPWKNNQPDISCVPPGSYICLWQWSSKHGCNLYHLQNVTGRTNCEIHSANIPQQLLGCISIGMGTTNFPPNSISEGIPQLKQRGITESRIALAGFEAAFRDTNTSEQLPFTITIE